MSRIAGVALPATTFAAVAALALRSASVAHLEGRAMARVPFGPRLTAAAQAITWSGDPARFFAMTAALSLATCRRRGLVTALRGGTLVSGATLTTQLLQRRLTIPRDFGWGEHAFAFPSGHLTGTTSLAVAGAMAAGPRPAGRPVVPGLLASLAMGGALLVTRTHVPSDLAGALCVTWLWAAVLADAGGGGQPMVGEP